MHDRIPLWTGSTKGFHQLFDRGNFDMMRDQWSCSGLLCQVNKKLIANQLKSWNNTANEKGPTAKNAQIKHVFFRHHGWHLFQMEHYRCVRMPECLFRSMFRQKRHWAMSITEKNRTKPKSTTRKQLFYAGVVSPKMAKVWKQNSLGKSSDPLVHRAFLHLEVTVQLD